jgi:uncharacterized protein with HEPN domain
LGISQKAITEFCQQHPEIPRRDIAGMRDVLIYKYDQGAVVVGENCQNIELTTQ